MRDYNDNTFDVNAFVAKIKPKSRRDIPKPQMQKHSTPGAMVETDFGSTSAPEVSSWIRNASIKDLPAIGNPLLIYQREQQQTLDAIGEHTESTPGEITSPWDKFRQGDSNAIREAQREYGEWRAGGGDRKAAAEKKEFLKHNPQAQQILQEAFGSAEETENLLKRVDSVYQQKLPELEAQSVENARRADHRAREWEENTNAIAGFPEVGYVSRQIAGQDHTPQEQKDFITAQRIFKRSIYAYGTKSALEQDVDEENGNGDTWHERWWRGVKPRTVEDITSLGWSEIVDMNRVAQISEKASQGKPLTDGEKALAQAYVIGLDAEARLQYLGGATNWGKAGEFIGDNAPFLIEMAVTGGLGTAAANAVKGLVRKGLVKAAGKHLRNRIARTGIKATSSIAGATAGGAAMAPFSSSTHWDFQARDNDQYDIGRDENGNFTAVKARPTSIAERAAKSFATGAAELSSELLGGHVGGLKLFPRISPQTTFGKVMGRIRSIRDTPAARRFDSYIGDTFKWNRLTVEWLEEEYSSFIQPLLTGEPERLKENFSSEAQWDLLLGVVSMSGAFGVLRTPFAVSDHVRHHKESTARLKSIENPNIRQLVQNAMSAQTKQRQKERLSRIDWDEASMKDMAAALDYVELKAYDKVSGGIAEAIQEQQKIRTQVQIFNKFVNTDTGRAEIVTDPSGARYFVRSGSLEGTGTDATVFVQNADTGEVSQMGTGELTLQKSYDLDSYLQMRQNREQEQANDTELANDIAEIAEEAEAAGIDPTPAIATRKGIDLDHLAGQTVALQDGSQVYVSQVLSENGKVRIDALPLDQAGEIIVDDNGNEVHMDLDVTRIADQAQSDLPVDGVQTGQTVTLRDGSQYMAIVDRDDQGGVRILGVNPDEVSAGGEKRVPLNRADIVAIDGVAMGQQAQTENTTPTGQQADESEQPSADPYAGIEPMGRGVFGNIYPQFRGKAREAIDFLMQRQEGEAIGALHHPQIGEIDLVWGSDKAGLQKIAQKHPEMLNDIQGKIEQMQVVQSSDNRIVLESANNKAIISKMLGQEKTPQWLLTAYEKKESSVSASSSDIETEPEGKQNGTATLQNGTSEEANSLHTKDTNSAPNEQEKASDIPRRKDGTPDYDQINDPSITAAALQSEFGEDALSVAQESLTEAREKLEQAAKIKKAIERKRAQINASKEIDKWEQTLAVLTPTQEVPKQAEYDQARRRMNEDVAEELAESNTGMGDMVTDDMHKRAPGVITVREQSDSNANNNFIQHYDIDGRTSGVYGIYDIEAGPNTDPVSFGLDEFSFRSENWDELESLYNEHKASYPDISSWIDSEGGAQFRDINDALDFKQFVDANRIDPVRDATTPAEKYRAVGELVSEMDRLSGAQTYVFNDVSELPQGLQQWFEPGDEHDGITWLGESYICAPKMQNTEQVRRTYIHEVAGHRALGLNLSNLKQVALCEKIVDDIGLEHMRSLGINELDGEIERYELSDKSSVDKWKLGREYIAYSTERFFTPDLFNNTTETVFSVDLSQSVTDETVKQIIHSANRKHDGKSSITITGNRATGTGNSIRPAQMAERRSVPNQSGRNTDGTREGLGQSANADTPAGIPEGSDTGSTVAGSDEISGIADERGIPEQNEGGTDRTEQETVSAGETVATAATPGEKFRAVGELVNEMNRLSGAQTYVFNDVSELPQGLSEQLEPGDEIDGITWLRESYICALRMADTEQTRRTYIHEVAGHQNVEYAIRKMADRTALWEAVVDDIGIETLRSWGLSELKVEIEKYENSESSKRQLGREAIAYSTELNGDLPYFTREKPLSLSIDLNQRITPETIREILNAANQYDNTRPEITITNPGREGILQNVDGFIRPSGGRIRTGDTARVENSGSNLSRNESTDPRGKDARRSGVEAGEADNPGAVSGQIDTGTDRTEQETVSAGETVAEDDTRFRAVYHGSPHDFDRFDHSFMGSGEGNQSFGWGTYVTEVDGIAKRYAVKLTPRVIQYGGEALSDVLDNEYYFDDAWRIWKKYILSAADKDELKKKINGVYIDGRAAGPRSKRRKEFERQKRELLDDIDSGQITIKSDPRNLYTVEIPDDGGGNYLKWSDDLSEFERERIVSSLSEIDSDAFDYDYFLDKLEQYEDTHNLTGEGLYKLLSKYGFDQNDQKASEALSQNGFAGIEYPAQHTVGGRADGAKNYVIFNDQDVQITDHVRFRNMAEANAAQLSPQEVNQRFNEQLDKLASENADSTILWLGNPSEALRSAGVENKPLKLYGNKVIKKMERHGFALDELKNLPQAVADPIAVFRGSSENSFAILTEIPVTNGNILVSVSVGKGEDLDFNIISSAYGKNDSSVINWINQNKLRYVNKQKALDYLHHPAPIAETSDRQGLAENASSSQGQNYLENGSDEIIDSATNIIKNFANPTLLDGEKVAAADVIATELNVPIRVVKNVAEIADSESDARSKRRNTGWHSRITGEIAVVLPNCADVAEVQKTILHEVVGHYGITQLLGRERADELYRRVFASIKDKATRKAYLEKYKNETVAGDEYLAEMAEGNVTPGTFRRIMAAVRAFFRDVLGIDLKLTDADMRYILWRSKHNLQNAKTVGEAMQTITDDLRMRKQTDYESACERKAVQLEKLRQAESVRITGEEVTPDSDMKQYKKNALEYGKTLRGEYTNRDNETKIRIGRSGIQEVLHHDFNDAEHLQTVAAIPQIIENSIYIDTVLNENPERHPSILSYDYYVCGLKIGDKDYTIKAVIANTVGGERYYDHKLTQIEKGKLIELVSRITNPGPSWSTSPDNEVGGLLTALPSNLSDIKDKRLLSVLQPEPLAYQPDVTTNPAKSEPKTVMEYLDQIEMPDEDLRFRKKPEPKPDENQEASSDPRMLKNKRERAKAIFVDKTQAVKNLQKKFGDIYPAVDVHAALYRKDSRIRIRMTQYQEQYINPITKTIAGLFKDYKIKQAAVETYLRAKHSLERHDSGTDALAKTGNWTRARVEAIIADFEQKVPHETVRGLWKQVNDANDATLRMLLESGLLTAYDYQNIKAKGWDHYVPLRGWNFEAEGTFDPVKTFNFQQSKRGTGGIEALKKAKGRHSESDQTLATIQHVAFTAIARAEDNIVGLHALRLAREHKNHPELLQLTNDWYHKSDEGAWVKMTEAPTKEQQDETRTLKRRVIELRNQLPALRKAARNQELSKGGRAENRQKIKDVLATMDGVNDRIRYKTNNGTIDNRPFTKEQQQEKSIEVFEFGQKYTIMFGDPDVANAIRGQRKPNGVVKFMGTGTRFLSKAYTAWTPEFILANFIRDLQMAGMYHLIDSDGNFKGYMRSIKPAAGSIHRFLAGGANPLTLNEIGNRKLTNHADRIALTEKYGKARVFDTLYDLFLANGGETGYIHIDEVGVLEKKLERDIQREIAKSTRTVAGKIVHYPTKGLFRAYMSGLDYLGTLSENTTRFATFVAIVESGKGITEATNYAKNVTVNFNVKGTSAQSLGSLYSFFNATVQGTATIVKLGTRKGNRKRFAFHVALMAFAGYLVPKLWDVIGWTDDDDERKEYSLVNFLTIPLPVHKRRVKIPIMQGFRAFYGFGALAYLWEKGEITGGEFGAKAAALVLDNSAPIPSPDFLNLTYEGVGRIVMPTMLVPIYDVSTNTNFMGGTIRREPFTTAMARTMPDSELYKRGVNEWVKTFTTAMNRLAGGNSLVSASVDSDGSYSFLGDLADQNPSNIEHLISGYTGGAGRFAMNVLHSLGSAIQGEVPETRNWPILNRFVEDVRPKNYFADFKEMNDRINTLNATLKRHVKEEMFDDRFADSFHELKVRQRAVNKKARKLKRANDELKDIWAQMDEHPDGSPEYNAQNHKAQDIMKKALNDYGDALKD